MIALSGVNQYPLKSAAGLALREALLEPLGLEQDRRWMVVKPDGSFLTGREVPRLVLLRAEPGPGGLRLGVEGREGLEVPWPGEGVERMEVTVWGDRCSAARAGEAADAWLSEWLGQPVRLVHVDGRTERQVDLRYAKPGDRVGFADAFPLLLVSEGSLEELGRRVGREVEMGRFRPNLVVRGCEPYAEDGWKRVRVGEAELEVVKPCARCVFTTVDPATAERSGDGEPLRTLSTFRKKEGKVYFGQNVLVRKAGRVRLGDAVEVLE